MNYPDKRNNYLNWRMLVRVVGWLLIIEALFMIIPLLFAIFTPGEKILPFALSIGITAASGGLMTLIRLKSKDLGKRDAIVLTGFVWVVLSLFGMLPFLFYGTHVTITDAFFETISGFTTTGVSVLETLEGVQKSLLVWRCVTQWIGGLGIILFTLAVVPMLNTSGGMQMFNAEVTGVTHDKLRPRVSYTAKGLWGLYAVLTALLIALLMMADIGFFDAFCYGLSTMSTGGFATTDAGTSHFNSVYIKIVMIIFMFIGGVNFSLIYNAVMGKAKGIWKNTALKVYIGMILGGTLIFIADILVEGLGHSGLDFTIDPLFQSVSLLSSTGITEPDFRDWGPFAVVTATAMMLVGACAGSTSGGAKVDRIAILFKFLKNEFYKMMHPSAVTTVKLNGRGTSPALVNKTLAFLVVYVLVIIGGGIFLSLNGTTLIDGFYFALQMISNTGLGSDATGLQGYSELNDVGKWVLSFIMLTGRLELFTVLLVFTPSFWKR